MSFELACYWKMDEQASDCCTRIGKSSKKSFQTTATAFRTMCKQPEQRKLAENFLRNMEDTVEGLLQSLDVWALRMTTRTRIFTVYHWCWVHAKERNWFILDRFCTRKWRKLGEISSNHNLLQQQLSSGVRIWSSTIARNTKDCGWKIKNPSAPDCSAQESQIEQKLFSNDDHAAKLFTSDFCRRRNLWWVKTEVPAITSISSERKSQTIDTPQTAAQESRIEQQTFPNDDHAAMLCKLNGGISGE